MQSLQNKKGKTDLTGLKILIGALSLTGTLGIWGLIANKPVEAADLTKNPEDEKPEDESTVVLQFPPLPTLVPIRETKGVQNVPQQTFNQQTGTLRQVTQPTLAPATTNSKPVFELMTVNRPGSGSDSGGGGGGGGSSSGSSR